MNINYKELENKFDDYSNNNPFPHIVHDNILDGEYLEEVGREINEIKRWDQEKTFHGAIKKRVLSSYDNFPNKTQKLIHAVNSKQMLETLEKLTGETSLIPDPYFEGGGIHSTTKGGYLKVHADFNWHKKLKLFRRINLLLYLTKNWKEEYMGNIEFWKEPFNKAEKAIIPKFGRMVIFTTDDKSFHGHPHPLNCPDNVWRNSIALYYYSSIKPKKKFSGFRLGTDYVPLKDDKFKRTSKIRKIWGSIKYRLFPEKF